MNEHANIDGKMISLRAAVRIYNKGYHAGHEDTVEAYYVDIFAEDMDSYHGDVVVEIITEADKEMRKCTEQKRGKNCDTCGHLVDGFCDSKGCAWIPWEPTVELDKG